MTRNVESHFSQAPSISIERSTFDRSNDHKTSFNVGELIPIYCDFVYPGDQVSIETSKIIRLQTLVSPIMDDLYCDTFWFFVPMRLVWEHTKEFFGENKDGMWVQPTTYKIPSISAPLKTSDNKEPQSGFATGTLGDYFGLPINTIWSNTDELAPMALPFRAYGLIFNEFFRDENNMNPVYVPTGDDDQIGTNLGDSVTCAANGGKPCIVAKYHDYFTSCLPGPQKLLDPVSFPLLSGTMAPVGVGSERHNPFFDNSHMQVTSYSKSNYGNASDKFGFMQVTNANSPDSRPSAYNTETVEFNRNSQYALTPVNLYADLSSTVGTVSINQLRLAFQLQKYYERAARSGSRYIEFIKAHFSVTSPDARMQRPEYLGGNRVPLTINQVTSTSNTNIKVEGTEYNSFTGDVGAMSATSDSHYDFEKAFTEHGFIIGLQCVRYNHTYSQGFERFWMRKNVEELYSPEFSCIGEQPVYDAELYATGGSDGSIKTGSVFGYQEAWADMRYKPSRVSGEMRPNASNTLASWHLADKYDDKPVLQNGFITENKSIVDRVLAVTSAVSNQVFEDIYFKAFYTRPMPVYSVPGLIDHF